MAVQAEPEQKRDDMPRNRQAREYTGRHRIKVTASGAHKKDPLPPPNIPDRPPRTAPALLSDTSRWYDPAAMRGIDPDIVSPVRTPEPPTAPLPPWMQPKRRMNPRYVTAAVFTGLLAIPTLFMAGWIANHDSQAAAQPAASTLAPGQANIPIVLVVNGQKKTVCITLANYGQSWNAWATNC